VAIYENAFGPEHRRTAVTLTGLASCRAAEGDPTGARVLYERALTIFERTLDPQNLGTANCLNGLARLLHHQGDLVGAQSFCERALGIQARSRRHCGPPARRGLKSAGF
jgi:hypothetical protein